ncbi:MAG TPA: A24 family peptidase [Caldilineaceae bacterium]|nr:A24 family peptidase [Caldilineaceae bacterium]
MSVIGLFILSIAAGWLINIAADVLPTKQTSKMTWAAPLWALPIGLRSQLAVVLPQRPMVKSGQIVSLRRYRVVFAATLLLGLLALFQADSFATQLVLAVQAWFFLTVAVIDLEHRLVLNRMLVAALPFVALANLLNGTPSLISMMLGGVAGFGFFLLLAVLAPGAMGMGDVKLAGFIGLVTGLSGVVAALFLGILAGGIAGLVVLIRNRFRRGNTLAYAPYLVLGAWLFLFRIFETLHIFLERL